METLTPDKDDLERFQQGRKSTANAAGHGTKAGNRGRRDTPQGQPAVARQGGRGLALTALLLAVIVAGAGTWQVMRQEQVIGELRQQLDEAHQSLNQSRLIIARLEGSLNETEASVAQSGTELSSRLKTIDSEIRKLWDVSNKRNIGLIKENQAKLKGLDASAKKLTERVATIEGSAAANTKTASAQQARLDELGRQSESLKTDLARVERESTAKTETLLREWQAQLDAFSKRLESLNAALAKQASGQALDGRVKEVETAIKSIDLNRQQLNQRILELERRLNETQLRVDAARTAPAGG